jgi:hypothetical protein
MTKSDAIRKWIDDIAAVTKATTKAKKMAALKKSKASYKKALKTYGIKV